MTEKEFRVATHCNGCGKKYRSRRVQGKKPPVRCKFCSSSKTEIVDNPEDHPQVFYAPVTFAEVRNGDEK